MTDVLVATASELKDALYHWLQEACLDWDEAVNAEAGKSGEVDLWDDMPVVDSKTVARTSPIFEKYLGIPLDVKLIRRGGYSSIDDVLADLLPKMEEHADSQGLTTPKDHAHE